VAGVRPNTSSPGSRITGAFAVTALYLAGCQFDSSAPAGGDGGSTGRIDADVDPGPDADPEADAGPVGGQPHLLLTEVKAEANAGEFIEIFNPTGAAVSLDHYYLSDDSFYATLPQVVRDGGPASIRNRDAVLQFPAGSSLAPGQVAVVAIDEAGFRATFNGRTPDFTIKRAQDNPQALPVAVRVGSATNPLELTDTGEAVMLFTWDGASDLVTDVDMVVVGNDPGEPGKDNGLPNKTAVSIDGPDAGEDPQQYAPDQVTMAPMSFRSGAGGSYKRLALEGSEELHGGGNGIAGHDETSENSQATWEQTTSPPSPGEVAGSLVADSLVADSLVADSLVE
jgi:hypothetical protein